MNYKTSIDAEDDRQEIFITRDFELPVELLFKAYEDAALLEQWMGTKVLRLENRPHGSYVFETSHNGKVVFRANGSIHEFVPNRKITRTFEMENAGFPVQLEFLEFEKLTEESSRLNMQIVFKSVACRNQLLKMPFSYGINKAHDALETLLSKLK